MGAGNLCAGIAALLVIVEISTASAAPAGTAPERDGLTRPLVVALAESPPFAIKEVDGTWSGLSVDLWREVATALRLRWEPREVELEQIDTLLHERAVDVALGAIAIDAQGAAGHDFSVPYYATGLGFADRATKALSWRTMAGLLAGSQLALVLGLMIGATLLVGVLIAFIERRHDASEFGGPLHRGIATGVWWAVVTMTTVGYGDATPKSGTGRSLALVWMFVGVIALTIFTASVTSLLTIGALQGAVQQPSDLFRLRLGAITGGAGAEYLTRRHVHFSAFDGPDQLLAALSGGRIDAVVANMASLRYLVSRQWQGVFRVSPIVLEPLSYAIGLPPGSPLRESIDRALLNIVEQDRWRDVEHDYLGYP